MQRKSLPGTNPQASRRESSRRPPTHFSPRGPGVLMKRGSTQFSLRSLLSVLTAFVAPVFEQPRWYQTALPMADILQRLRQNARQQTLPCGPTRISCNAASITLDLAMISISRLVSAAALPCCMLHVVSESMLLDMTYRVMESAPANSPIASHTTAQRDSVLSCNL